MGGSVWVLKVRTGERRRNVCAQACTLDFVADVQFPVICMGLTMSQPKLEPRMSAPEILAELADFMADAWAAQLSDLPSRLRHLPQDAQRAVMQAAEEARDDFTVLTMAACDRSVKEFVAASRKD